jgi:GMP synthase (glutamine-hydrolysing)
MIIHHRGSSTGRVGSKLRQRGLALDVRCPVEGDPLPDDLRPFAGAVIFGGAMSANDDRCQPGIRAELEWLPRVLEAGTPFLGICLGAQLLARVLGARVEPHPQGEAEIGYFDLRPTAAGRGVFPRSMTVYHWHKEGFSLPSGATLLATGERFPHQAFRYAECAYGIQFHPEVELQTLRGWLTNASASLALPGAQPPATQLEKQAQHDSGIERWTDEFLDFWLAGRQAECVEPPGGVE